MLKGGSMATYILLSTLTDEEIEQRAQQAAAQCVAILLGRFF